MTHKYNVGDGKKARNYGSKGGGMHRHATSGHAHNHANSIAMVREYNKEQERLATTRRKPKMYGSVREALFDKSH